MEGNFNIMKTIHRQQLISFLMMKKTFPLRSRSRQGCLLFSFKICLGDSDQLIGQEKEINGIQIGKEEVKVSLFTNNITLYPKIWKF